MSNMRALFNQLPKAAQTRITEALSDEGRTIDQININFILYEVTWVAREHANDLKYCPSREMYEQYINTIDACNKILKQYDIPQIVYN